MHLQQYRQAIAVYNQINPLTENGKIIFNLILCHSHFGEIDIVQNFFSILASAISVTDDMLKISRKIIDTMIDTYSTLPSVPVAIHHLYSNQLIAALDQALSLVESNPFCEYSHLVVGNCYFALEQFEEAKNCYKKSLELNIDCEQARHNLGLCYIKLDRPGDAKNVLKSVPILESLLLLADIDPERSTEYLTLLTADERYKNDVGLLARLGLVEEGEKILPSEFF